MKQAANRLKQENGASLALALLFFVICGMAASVILAAASATAGKMEQIPSADQKRFTVESAAAFLRDELMSTENVIKIKEVQVVNEHDSTENSDTVTYYYVGKDKKLSEETSWTEISDSDASILASYVKKYYVPLGVEEGSDDSENSDGSSGTGSSEDEIIEEDSKDSDWEFVLSVNVSSDASLDSAQEEDSDAGNQTSENQTAQTLQAKVQFSMASNYGITAVISDLVTDTEKNPEDLCQRVLTIPAALEEETDVDIRHETEEDDNGITVEEWNVITTTRWTTIQWQRGTIKTVKTETNES